MNHTVIKRYARPEESAIAFFFLLSDAASFIGPLSMMRADAYPFELDLTVHRT